MYKPIQLAAHLALLTVSVGAYAQVSSPDKLVAAAPRNPSRHASQPQHPDDLQWLWPFAKPAPNGRAYDLRVNARFQSVLAENFKQPQAMWGAESATTQHPPLTQVIPLFLTKYGAVSAESNRYVVVDGCVPSFCPAAGLLWIDTASEHPLMVFAATDWSTVGRSTDDAAAEYNLWLFPNRVMEPDELPLALTQSLAHWQARLAAAHRLVPHVAHAIVVQPGGQPAALDPALAGMNTLQPQPDTLTPPEPEAR